MADSNSLGLDFEKETATTATTEEPPSEVESKPEKKRPYVNRERVKTGGPQREKPSEDELAELMQRMKEKNEKIKQRRQDVEADKDAFRKMQEADRVKQAQTRKVQEGVDRTREQNAQRKMEKIQSREWDSGKPTGEWKEARGGPRGRGRGRGGRGAGPGRRAPDAEPAPTPTPTTTAATAATAPTATTEE